MKRVWKCTICAVALLALTACNQAVPAADSEPLPKAETYWTVDVEGGEVALRSGGAESLLLVWMKDGEERVLKTLEKETDYYEPENVTAWAFPDIMGYEGFALRAAVWGGSFGSTYYYAIEENALKQIADSFGFETEDTAVDLDGDGQTELATNNTYGGDGYRTVAVFRRTGEGIERGEFTLPEIPDHDNWGINSHMSEYDPLMKVFRITYSIKDQDEPGFLETTGLEWFTFSAYEPE